jgi:hypothetical protein
MKIVLLCLVLSACAQLSAPQKPRTLKPPTMGECLQQRGMSSGLAAEGIGGMYVDHYAIMSCEAEIDHSRRAGR